MTLTKNSEKADFIIKHYKIILSKMEIESTDIGYENELLKSGNSVKFWLIIISLKKDKYLPTKIPEDYDPAELASMVDPLWVYYDRAVSKLPRSYKIWIEYCDTRSSFALNYLSGDKTSIQKANGTYERALLNLWTCPVIWLDYLDFLGKQRQIILLRRTFNRALQSLPITQHDRIWERYLHIIRDSDSIETVDNAYRRFLRLHPEFIEDACEYFLSKIHINPQSTKKAGFYIEKLLENPNFKSLNNRSKYYWWCKFTELLQIDPEIEHAEQIIRNGCKDFVIDTGQVWVLLAKYYASLGLFEDAIQTFEEGLDTVITANDFAKIFQGEMDLLFSIATKSDTFSMFMQRLNDLLNRREILLNATRLRHDKNNVLFWIEKVTLYLDKDYHYDYKTRKSLWQSLESMTTQHGQLAVMEEAIETVDPRHAGQGKYGELWTNLSKIVDIPFVVLEAALTDDSLLASDVVCVYQYYAEFELANHHYENALEILHRATDDRRANGSAGSSELWSLAIDVEWSLNGSEHPAMVKEMFENCLNSRSCTMQHILAYANFLDGLERYDEMFRVYERGISQVGWPYCSTFWLFYINKFISLYGGKRRERVRDIFEDALKDAPKEEALAIFILYAKYEEDFGLLKRAMDIYKRAADLCQNDDIFNVWVASGCRLFGVPKAREVYEYAIETYRKNRDDEKCSQWCLKYARFEAKLTEFDRARRSFIHGTQFSNPATCTKYWEEYEQFEVKNGTKETFKEMLSQKNLAVARFNRTTHIGMHEEGKGLTPEDEELEYQNVEGSRLLSVKENQIPETIYENGIFSAMERIQKKRKT